MIFNLLGFILILEESFASSDVNIGYKFTHIALSCDDLTLATCFKRDGAHLLGFMDVRAFFSNVSGVRTILLFECYYCTYDHLTHNACQLIVVLDI